MERQFFRPAKGRLVRMPGDGTRIPAEGRMVPVDDYFRRRARDADGELLKQAPKPSPKAKASAENGEG
jgi:hypothetical protein